MRFSLRRRASIRAVSMLAVAAALTALAGAGSASANAADPNPDIAGTATLNADGSVSVDLSGTWSWPGQNCAGRYGTGWAVDWWGVSSSATPAKSFSLTNATTLLGAGNLTRSTISPVGAVPTASHTYFHVAQYYGGEVANSAATCTDVAHGSTGGWKASATYPSRADLPPQVCVNMYDEHGKEGQPSTKPDDYNPVRDKDNSIQTNHFDPTAGAGYCAVPKVITQTVQGEIYKCVAGAPTATLATGGSLAVPAAGLSSANPLAAATVPAGTYTLNATAPSGQKFVACGQTGVTIAGPGSASRQVTVPAGGAGDGKFYVQPVTQTIQSEIYKCVGGAPSSTLVTGGSLAVPTAGLNSANPLAPSSVAAGTYTVNATAPAGQKFVACGQTGVTIPSPGSASQPVTVPQGGAGDAKFYAQAITYGYLEICKSSANGVTGTFSFTFNGQTVSVPAGACSPAIQVPSGQVVMHENAKTGYTMAGAVTTPTGRLVGVDLAASNVTVTVVAGDVSSQTIVTVTNTPVAGQLKVCQVAGAGVAVGTSYSFTNSANGATITVPAGPAPGGYCVPFAGTFTGGKNVTLTQTIPAGTYVSSITVAPSNRLVGTPDLAHGSVVVLVGSGVTEATFTDAKN